MKKQVSLFFALALIATASCQREPQQEVVLEEETPLLEEAGYEPGIILVRFADEAATKSVDLTESLRDLGITAMYPVFPEEECPVEFRERERAAGLREFYFVEYDPAKAPVTKASLDLSSLPGIISAEPQPQVFLNDAIFNDPGLSTQWHYINSSTPGADVNCLPVWQEYTTGNPDVIVSVVDEGVDLEHEDLAWNCIPGGSNGSRNFADGNYDVEPMSHGTHVAGTIAAVNNNGKGVSGIAGGNFAANKAGVKIMSCQFFGTKRNGSSADAIRWGANHGAVISQNSWGYVVDINEDGHISADELERAKNLRIDAATKAAVDYFIKYAGCDASGNQKADSPMKGGIVIFAAGNDNIAYGAPANYEPILAVGAIDRNGRRSSFSNYGDWVDICAPGTSIYSTLPGNKYGNSSGTSMACPHVSGVAALVVSYCGGLGFTADMLWTKLVNGANPNIVSASGTHIGPLVDAYGAILYGDSGEPNPITEYSVGSQSNNVNLTWNVTPTSKGSASYAAMLFASKEKSALETMDPAHPGKEIVRANKLTSTYNVGDEVTGTITGLEFETKYYVTLAAYSYDNGYSALAPIKEVTTGINNAPYVTVALDPIPAHKNYEIWSIPLNIGDPDGHEITVTYKAGSAADSLQPDTVNGGYMIQINGPLVSGGTYTGTITVTDQYGLSVSKTVTYTLLPNNPPVVVNPIDNQQFDAPGKEKSFPIEGIFKDEDGEPLALDVQVSDKTTFHAVSDGENLIVTALAYGASKITVTATDARGESASMSFGVISREASVEVSLYPTPVEDNLYISTGMEEKETAISIYGATGALVYTGKQNSSAFTPAVVDMAKCAPGKYSVVFTYGDKKYNKTVIKK